MSRPLAVISRIALAASLPAAALALASAAVSDGASMTTRPPSKGVTSEVLFTFKDDRIKESSGIETSERFRKILYTHNDSGDDARFFAVGPGGATRAVYTLDGAGSWDWEDMSGGPNKTLWFADIGANQLGREYISAFKVREPKKLSDRELAWTRYDFKYDDDQSHNAEAMLVNPVTGALLVVTKAENGAGVYRATLPLSTSGYNTLNRVADAPVKVTGGDFSANGKRFVLRTYGQAYFYHRVGGHATQISLPSGGESIAFARYSRGLIAGKEGVHSPVWHVVRTQD